MNYCKECLYPSVSVLLNIHDDGICSGCRSHKAFLDTDDDFWNKREKKFQELLMSIRVIIIMIVLSQ